MADDTPLVVHMLHDFGDDARAQLLAALDDSVDVTWGDAPSAATRVLVGGRPTSEHLLACPLLERLIVPWAGVPPAIGDAARQRPGLRVHNLHHNAAATAETAVALLLAAAKCLVPQDAALRRGDWSPRYEEKGSLLLDGQSALVLGLGAIGSRVARALCGLGMRVAGTRRGAVGESVADGVAVHPPGHLPTLLTSARVLVIALPLTDETRGLIGERELAALPSGAVLVNVGRGPIVDEAALYAALASGRLAAAGLDVWYRYPKTPEERTDCLPSTHPFHELSNVVLSPHRAGHASGIDTRRMADLALLLNAIARDEHVPNAVDPSRGY
jgi:phosphoglycerate dehydrogenase-like enzyme